MPIKTISESSFLRTLGTATTLEFESLSTILVLQGVLITQYCSPFPFHSIQSERARLSKQRYIVERGLTGTRDDINGERGALNVDAGTGDGQDALGIG